MPVKNPKELFVLMLSDLRQGSERTTKVFHELSEVAQDPDVKEALEARVFVSQKVLDTLDQCFKLMGEQPLKLNGRLYEVFAEDFRRELAEIQNPTVRHLFILAKASHLIHLRISEYKALIAAADLSGHYGVGVLLESLFSRQARLRGAHEASYPKYCCNKNNRENHCKVSCIAASFRQTQFAMAPGTCVESARPRRDRDLLQVLRRERKQEEVGSNSELRVDELEAAQSS